MKLAVFGATGGTGRHVVAQALSAGHEVVALVRDPARLSPQPDLTIIEGNVLDETAVSQTVAGADAVVVSLGHTGNNPEKIVSQGTAVVVTAMKAAAVSRLLVVTSLGVGDSRDQVPLAFKMIMKTVLRKPMADKEIQEQIVRDSGLDWTIVRPGGLTDGPATGQYRVGVGSDVVAGQVARADVAAFILQQISDDSYVHQAPGIT